MLSDPLFYLVAIPAVLLYGVAKGGFAGPAAVPLMSLVMSPTQAAAILLPILVVMDVLVVKTYWGIFDRRTLQIMLPGALVGIAIGYLSADQFNDNHMRLLVGLLSLGLASRAFLQSLPVRELITIELPAPCWERWRALPASVFMRAGRPFTCT